MQHITLATRQSQHSCYAQVRALAKVKPLSSGCTWSQTAVFYVDSRRGDESRLLWHDLAEVLCVFLSKVKFGRLTAAIPYTPRRVGAIHDGVGGKGVCAHRVQG
jgi:hypothetical protein